MAQGSVVFDRAADYYDQTRGFPAGEEKAVAAMIVDAAHLTSTSRMLEIGVGTGRIALPVAPSVGEYVGVDLSRLMMQHLRKKQTSEPIDLLLADAVHLPLASHTFDAAIAVHVFHLIPAYQEVAAELARVLKPDAPLLLGHNWRMAGRASFQPMLDAWASFFPPEQSKRVGVQEDEEDTFLLTLGWRKVGEQRTHEFVMNLSPRQQLERQARRVWSNAWQTDDEAHARAIEEVKRVMEAHYPDPDQPIDIHTGFDVDVYLPPA